MGGNKLLERDMEADTCNDSLEVSEMLSSSCQPKAAAMAGSKSGPTVFLTVNACGVPDAGAEACTRSAEAPLGALSAEFNFDEFKPGFEMSFSALPRLLSLFLAGNTDSTCMALAKRNCMSALAPPANGAGLDEDELDNSSSSSSRGGSIIRNLPCLRGEASPARPLMTTGPADCSIDMFLDSTPRSDINSIYSFVFQNKNFSIIAW